jgi:hypothetical protein
MKKKPIPIILGLAGVCVLCGVFGMIYSATPAGKAAATERSLTQTAKPTNTIQPTNTTRPSATTQPTHTPTNPPTDSPTVIPTIDSRSNPLIIDTPAAASECPQGCTTHIEGCDIKGNISSSGEKIYHTTSSSSYNATKIDPSKGERWFCTVEEAKANGWRAPR